MTERDALLEAACELERGLSHCRERDFPPVAREPLVRLMHAAREYRYALRGAEAPGSAAGSTLGSERLFAELRVSAARRDLADSLGGGLLGRAVAWIFTWSAR